MEKNERKSNKSIQPIIIAVVAIVIVAVIIAVVVSATKSKTETENNDLSAVEQSQIDNSNKLNQIQDKIDAQQKVIDDLNGKLTPLIEERTKLEKELAEIKRFIGNLKSKFLQGV